MADWCSELRNMDSMADSPLAPDNVCEIHASSSFRAFYNTPYEHVQVCLIRLLL